MAAVASVAMLAMLVGVGCDSSGDERRELARRRR
jgi:hypothetical protein